VKTGTKTVIIADSNLQLAKNLPSNWEVHAYPGMNFKNAIAAVSSVQPPTTLENIIIAVAINHLGLSFTKTTQTDMNKLQRAVEIHSTQNAFMTGVSTGSSRMKKH